MSLLAVRLSLSPSVLYAPLAATGGWREVFHSPGFLSHVAHQLVLCSNVSPTPWRSELGHDSTCCLIRTDLHSHLLHLWGSVGDLGSVPLCVTVSRKNCLQIGGYGGGRGESMRLLQMDLNGKLEVFGKW